jgi:uncharacterized protein (TIGR00290 family)
MSGVRLRGFRAGPTCRSGYTRSRHHRALRTARRRASLRIARDADHVRITRRHPERVAGNVIETEAAVVTKVEPILLAWSGGKDSTLALEELNRSARWRVVRLLTTVTEAFDRITMHGVRTELLREQARALGLPLTVVGIPPGSDNDLYEERMAAALASARGDGVRSVAFGDLFLEEVRQYREVMLAKVGMRCVFPLWGLDTYDLAERFISSGYEAVLTCVDTEQIPGSFAGKPFDREMLGDLPPSADPCGENGEFHTFVYNGPLFAQPVWNRLGELVLRDGRFMYADLVPEQVAGHG